jgi:hypothetical protein
MFLRPILKHLFHIIIAKTKTIFAFTIGIEAQRYMYVGWFHICQETLSTFEKVRPLQNNITVETY